MKKTIACLAMIASATTASTVLAADGKNAGKDAKKEASSESRKPANGLEGYTFAGCRPAYAMYSGDQAYKNDCTVPLQSIAVPQGGMAPRGATRQVAGCDQNHQLVVTSYPLSFSCLPPGVVEL